MKIEYPNEREINESIDYICDKADIRKSGFFTFLYDMTRSLGIGNIFYGVKDAIFITLCLFVGTCVYIGRDFFTVAPEKTWQIVNFTFAASPALFFVMFLLSYAKEKSLSVYPVKMTCRYTVNHLLAYRMFVFSLLSVVFDTVYVLILSMKFTEINAVTLLCVSLSSLFIFSLILIFAVLSISSVISPIVVFVLWTLINGALTGGFSYRYAQFLQAVPVGVYVIIILAASVLYINRISTLLQYRRKNYVRG